MLTKRPEVPVHPAFLPTVSPEAIIELLRVQKNKGEELLKSNFLSMEDVQYWNLLTKGILTKAFGPHPEYIDSIIYAGEQRTYPAFEPDSILEKERRKNFSIVIKKLETFLEQLNPESPKSKATEKDEILEESQKNPVQPVADEGEEDLAIDGETTNLEINKRAETMEKTGSRKVFIIHGQDEEKKMAVANFLRKLDLEPIIPREHPAQEINLIDKFEQDSGIVFAITLLTADDYGYPKGKPEESKPRPKQNIVFELGFLVGRMKQNLVCALYEEGLDLPPEYRGRVFIPYDADGLWKLLIARSMKLANVNVDLNQAM